MNYCVFIFTKVLTYIISDVTINENSDRVSLLVSDGAAYMMKAGKTLQSAYPAIIHVTCLAHVLHQVCEFVRGDLLTN